MAPSVTKKEDLPIAKVCRNFRIASITNVMETLKPVHAVDAEIAGLQNSGPVVSDIDAQRRYTIHTIQSYIAAHRVSSLTSG